MRLAKLNEYYLYKLLEPLADGTMSAIAAVRRCLNNSHLSREIHREPL